MHNTDTWAALLDCFARSKTKGVIDSPALSKLVLTQNIASLKCENLIQEATVLSS